MKNNYIRGYDGLKRLIDCVVAGVGILILSPVFLIVMLVLKIETPDSKVIFKQERIGRKGNHFFIFKFRSLREDAPRNLPTKKLQEGRFVTKFGYFMRVTGLDELPQLINIANGDMSLVGPRPLIPEEGTIHEERMERGVYNLRPGITGLAQIHGGNSISDYEKLYWDCKYLANRGMLLDLKICVKTILLCIRGRITPQKDNHTITHNFQKRRKWYLNYCNHDKTAEQTGNTTTFL